MILRLIFSLYFLNCVISAEWDTFGFLSSTSRPFGIPNVSADGKQEFKMGYNPYSETVPKEVLPQGVRKQVLEVSNPNSQCYSLKSMMTMMRGLLLYLAAYPNKINYLHYLINFLRDDDATPNEMRLGKVVNVIQKDDRLPYHEKQMLRNMLRIETPQPELKTKIIFKYELPSLKIPQCKDVFINLMESAHDKYMQFTEHPTCQVVSKDYDKSDSNQPNLPDGVIDGSYPDFINKMKEFLEVNPTPNFPENPNIDYTPEKPNVASNKPDQSVEAIITDLLPNWPETPFDGKPSENGPQVIPKDDLLPPNDKTPLLDNLTPEITPQYPSKLNDLVIAILDAMKPDSQNPSYHNNIEQLTNTLPQLFQNSGLNPKLLQYIVSFLKSDQNSVEDSKMIAITLELLSHQDEGQTSNKLIEILLPLLIQNKSPDPKIIQVILPLLKQGRILNLNTVELILTLLKMDRNDIAKPKYQIIFTLLHPDVNADIKPKFIEILNYLLKVNDNLTSNDKIIEFLFSFFLKPEDANKLSDPRTLDILLHVLKLNNNHRLPDKLYYLILQFLSKLSQQSKLNADPNLQFYNPLPHTGLPQMSDRNLLIMLLKNPHLLKKIMENKHASMPGFQQSPIGTIIPNKFSPNTLGTIELTYFLKHPQPFVYQPFYYVKYRLPVPTFVSNLRNLITKNPRLTSDPTKLYQELITVSNVTEVSPNLQGFSIDDVMKMTVNNGALVTAKIIDDKNNNFNERLKIVQNLNAEVHPDDILKQTKALDNLKFDGLSPTLQQFWNVLPSESKPDSIAPTIMETGVPVIKQVPGPYQVFKPNDLPLNSTNVWGAPLFQSPSPLQLNYSFKAK